MPEPPPVTMQVLFVNRMRAQFALPNRDARVTARICAQVARTLRFGVATADHQCEAYDGHDDIRDVWERVRALVPRGRATDFWNRYREDIAARTRAWLHRLSFIAILGPSGTATRRLERRSVRALSRRVASDSRRRHVGGRHAGAQHLAAARASRRRRRRIARSRSFPIASSGSPTEVAQRLGDLIDDYVTLNEPDQLVYGWIKGFWMRAYAMPPGQPPYQSGEAQMDDVLTLIPNLFRAHCKAREAIKRFASARPRGRKSPRSRTTAVATSA